MTSEVFERAWKANDRYDPARGSRRAWLFGVARHTVTDHFRRRRDVPVAEVPETPADGPDPSELAVAAGDAERLHTLLASLADRERDALAMRFAGGLTSAEIAETLGLTPGAVKMLVFRAVQKLRAAVTDG